MNIQNEYAIGIDIDGIEHKYYLYNKNDMFMSCSCTKLISLDLSNCPNVTTINCSKNFLKKLDISNCTKLAALYCENNFIEFLDLSKNKELIILDCRYNNLNKLDISNNTKLIDLQIDNIVDASQIKHINYVELTTTTL